MKYTEAKELLLLHSYGHENIEHPKLDAGFLGMLRPYRGLNEGNYHEVMQAIVDIAPHLRQAPTIDRDVVSSLWAICHLGYMWGVHPDGMLRRNNLIAPDDVERLSRWIEDISYATLVLLGDGDIEEATGLYKWNSED